MSATALLDVRDLTVTLRRGKREIIALDHASFTVEPGEVLGLVGESGAGKSVTGAALVDLLVPPLHRTEGTITLAGERLDRLNSEAMRHIRGRRIGFVFQDPLTSLNPVLTIGNQLVDTMVTHLPLSRREAHQRAIHWIARVGLSEPAQRVDQYPHQLSGGMRQRIVIALALCAEPSLVIADEPTSALDVSVQAHILTLLRDLRAETGVGLLLITHDLGVLAKMADRVAVLYAGRIVELGRAADIFRRPQHPYTAGLMHATPTAKIGRLESIPGSMPSLGAVPSGCAFHPRCPRAQADCKASRPDLQGAAMDAFACFHPLGEDAS